MGRNHVSIGTKEEAATPITLEALGTRMPDFACQLDKFSLSLSLPHSHSTVGAVPASQSWL